MDPRSRHPDQGHEAPGSRHLIARFRFNHVVQSIWHDTARKCMHACFPDVEFKEDKASWFWEFPNGSQIWFGGLDDRERTEKILGLEFSSVLLNEVSQISFHLQIEMESGTPTLQ